MVNMGLKKREGLLPQTPSEKGAQGEPPRAQALRPLAVALLLDTRAGGLAVVAVAR
jgi:hypothetical protein